MERIIKADPLTTTREVAEELNVTHSMNIWHLTQTGKVKKLGKRVPHELTEIQNIVVLKCQLLLFYATNNNEWFLDQIVTWQKVDYIWPTAMTNSVIGLRRSSKVLPKAKLKLTPKKVMVTVWWSACCLSDPLQLSESQRNYYIWEVCSANRWDALKTVMPEAGIGQQTGPSSPLQHPTAHCITNASKVEQIELWGFASSAIFTWPLANWLQLLQASRQTFCRENASTTSRRQKMLSKSLLNLKARIFMLQE